MASDKHGWPWEYDRDPIAFRSSKIWPHITIITPSFNQGRFLEETILSVLSQNYPNLEYMVIDGGSTDNSVEIIRKYEDQITYWVSEPDRGQAHAINKGFERCTGDLVGWINSDDMLLQGSLEKLAVAHLRNPKSILLGDVIHFYQGKDRTDTVRQKNISFETMALMPASKATWQQPGTFVPSKLFQPEKIFLDESFRYVFDQDWMCRLLKKTGVLYLSEPVAMFREHPASKTVGENTLWLPELQTVIQRYWDEVPGVNKKKILAYFETFQAAVSLGAKKWDRKMGRKHLREALRLDPALLFSPPFLGFCFRSVMPHSFLLWVRKQIKKYR